MNQNFYFGFTSPDDRLPTGKSGYSCILKHRIPNQQPSSVTTRIRRVRLKALILQKIRVAQDLGPKKLLLLPFAQLIYLGIVAMSKFIDVSIYCVSNDRFGHFVLDTELTRLTALERKFPGKWELNIYCSRYEKSSNKFLIKIWKRELHYISGLLGSLISTLAQKSKKSNLCKAMHPFDIHLLLLKYPNTIRFSKNETSEGVSFLRNLGLGIEDPIVCLNVRDSAYLTNTEPISWSKKRDWSYHDHRNSNIDTYVRAAETLANAGYAVFRMGAIVENRLKSNHPFIFDYATNGMRTDFLDIFLGSQCAFTVSTGSGWCSVSDLFRKPILFVNNLPIFAETLALQHIVYPKILQDNLTKNDLGLDEIIERNVHGSLFSAEYAHAGVKIKDLSSEELVEAVSEMAARVEGTFVETTDQKQMQAKLNNILSTHPKLQPTPNYYPIRAEFASCFLSNYPNFLD